VRFVDQVVVVTGAAAGQGAQHAASFAAEGADVIGVDVGDLAATAAAVEGLGRRFCPIRCDVRDGAALEAAMAQAVEALSPPGVVVVNAGIVAGVAPSWELTTEMWEATIGVNLTGAWQTVRCTVPHMIAAGRGGSIVITGSTAGVRGEPNISHYSASKHGLHGLATSLARELGDRSIRVNLVNPTTVDTPMVNSEAFFRWLCPDLAEPSRDDVVRELAKGHVLPVGWIDTADVTAAVMWLASGEARYVTGQALAVDAGATLR